MKKQCSVLICYQVRGHLGLRNKLETLARGFREAGCKVNICYVDATARVPARIWQLLRTHLAFCGSLIFRRHAIIFVRYNYHFIVMFLLARLFPRKRMNLEWNSDHLNEFSLQGQRLRGLIDEFAFHHAVRSAACVHVVSRELIDRYSTKNPSARFLYNPNFVVDPFYSRHENLERRPVRIVFLGDTAQPWQGIEIFIERALAGNEWFAANGELHLIGHVSEATRACVHRYGLADQVYEHGLQHGERKRDLLASMHVGIGVFNLKAKGMRETTSIKVGEYLYAGLPIIIGYEDLSLPPNARFVLSLSLTDEDEVHVRVNSFLESVCDPAVRRQAHEYAAQQLMVHNYVSRVLEHGVA